jgi:hypothetical protein
MNKIGAISIKVMLGVVLAMDLIVAALILDDSVGPLELIGSNQPWFTVYVLQHIFAFLLILGSIVSALLCLLSRKKWLITAGMVIFFFVAAYSGYLAFIHSTIGFIITTVIYLALSIGAVLLSNLSLHRLSSHQQDETALMKPIGFMIGFTIVLILFITTIWLSDEPLDPNFHRFYTDNHKEVVNQENVAVGLAGLDASSGVDFLQVGLAAFKSAQAKQSLKQSEAQLDQPKQKDKIAFVGTKEELNCWIGLREAEDIPPQCASEQRLKDILQANKTLLERYWKITQLQHFQGLPANNQIFVDIHRLIAAEIRMKLNHGNYEDAYTEWLTNQQFVNRMIEEEAGWTEKAIFSVADSYSQASAESLFHIYKGVGTRHGDELIALFNSSGLSRWNLPGTLRAEYDVWQPFVAAYEAQFWFHPNYIRNKWLHSSQAFIAAARVPQNLANQEARKVLHESGGFRSWSNDYLKDPMNTVLVRGFLLDSLGYKSIDVLKSMHIRDAKQKALTLILLIKRRDLKDGEIANFMENADPELRNPFTGKAMNWDVKKRAIVFNVPKTSGGGDEEIIDVRM